MKIFEIIKDRLGFGKLPPGCHLETNGRHWRWGDESGYTTIFQRYFRSSAVRDAWDIYQYRMKQKKMIWRKVE